MKRGLAADVKSPVRLVHGLVCATGMLLLVGAVVTVAPRPTNALPKYTAQTGLACGRCHTNSAGGGPRTAFGKAFAANGHKVPGRTESRKVSTRAKKRTTGGEPQVVASQKPGQWLASNFTGTDVLNSKGNKIGSVADILFDKSGKIEAYVVSFGAFAGMDAKQVAITPGAFQVVPGKNNESEKLKLTMDEKQLRQAPQFSAHKRP